MPTYEYHCKECGYSFDFFSTVAEKERKERDTSFTCEKCGSDKIEQVFGGFSILSGAQVRKNIGGGSSCCGGGNCC
jgi:putative FmdB family regulatory protein